MIVISSGFPKSASTLLFLYTEHLFSAAGKSQGQRLFRRFNKEGFTPHFGFLNTPWYILLSLFGPLVIKTHAGPTFFVRLLIGMGLAKAYYSVRDPRDAVLSAMDHAKKAREKGIQSDSDVAFAPFKTWDDLFPAFHMHHQRYEAWKRYGKALFLRYEDVVTDPAEELTRVVHFLDRKKLEPYIPETVQLFGEKKQSTKNFNKGAVTRYREELNAEQLELLEKKMGPCITSMGYTLNAAR